MSTTTLDGTGPTRDERREQTSPGLRAALLGSVTALAAALVTIALVAALV